MASYGSNPTNPDTRPLPPGWIQQYDRNYNTWFYVNTSVNPPQSSWVHPAGPPGSPQPPAAFAPPQGPPPPNSPYNNSPYPPQPVPGYGQQQPPPQPWSGGPPGGGYGNAPRQGAWQGDPYQQDDRGWFNGRPQQPQVVYQQAPPPPPKKGIGMGGALAIGGAGLLGGALLEDVWDNHEDNVERESYDDGYQDGQNNDFDPGNDDGGW